MRAGPIEPIVEEDKRNKPGALANWMGTAFSRGNGDHLPPMKVGEGFFLTETQADVLRPELVIEETDHDPELWSNAAEEGLVRVPKPEQGRQLGQVGRGGDPRQCRRHDRGGPGGTSRM